jgi:hypothetical protein
LLDPHDSHEGGTEDNSHTPLAFMVGLTLWMAILDGRPVDDPSFIVLTMLCRPLPPSLDVAGARFRPSPTATVCGLLPLSFAGYPRVGITLGRRRASALRRTIYSNLVCAPAGAGFRASAGFTSPRLRSLGDRCAVVHQLWVLE